MSTEHDDGAALQSAVYFGRVAHARHRPRPHRFGYRLFYLYLDLDEVETLFDGAWLWSHERFNVANFRRRDYFGSPDRPLRDCVRERVTAGLGAPPPDGPIRLLTHVAFLGLGFNPVSFYYLFEPGGERLHSILAEITNTPWNERFQYVLAASEAEVRDEWFTWTFDKDFHVSPFFGMNYEYRWSFTAPRTRAGSQLRVSMENHGPGEGGERAFDATLSLTREDFTRATLRRCLWRHPWITGKVHAGIYFQALRLWLKRTKFHTHPDKTGGDRPMNSLDAEEAPQLADSRDSTGRSDARGQRASLLERAVRARLRSLEVGSLTLRTAEGSETFGQPREVARRDHVDAIADVHDDRFWSALALRGSIGSGEAFARGWWTSPEPVDVVRVFVANLSALDRLERGLARLSVPLLKFFHAVRDNTRGRAEKNISAHYDLSNEFFALFLDQSMTYSSAYFENEAASLADAQTAKIDRLCRKLALGPSDHLLEIGTGWGAFAIRAASEFGCKVTTTTISKQQFAFARDRVAAAGLESKVDVRLEDYRDLSGTYSKIVSVEMIEAVGARHYGRYFESAMRLLGPGGVFGLQAITIHDRHFERARRAVDFIQRHIFPGSCIPSITALCEAARDASDFKLVALDDFGGHYVRTLRTWRDELRARRDDALALGFDNEFLRLFDYYFAYCEGGFAERHISVAQMVFAREGRGFDPISSPR